MKIILLTGHRKSGTTMLHSLFDNHSELSVYPTDISFLYAYFPYFTAQSDDPVILEERLKKVVLTTLKNAATSRGAQTDVPFDPMKFWELFRSAVPDDKLRNMSFLTLKLAESWALFEGRKPSECTAILKETSTTIYLEELMEFIPDLKTVHLVRDPRDNYAALKSGVATYYEKLGESRLQTLASFVNRAKVDFNAAAYYKVKAPASFRALSFEDLTSRPNEITEEIAAFMGIAWEQTLLKPSLFGASAEGNNYEKKKFDTISTANVGRWRDRITGEEAGVIEFWLKSEMALFNYIPEIDPSLAVAATREFYKWYNSKYFFADSFR